MITEFKIPELGENIESGNVVRVLVSAGQTIEKDQAVLELETDKATIEVPSPVGGVVREVRVSEGSKAKVGDVVLTIETQGASAEPAKPAAKPQPAVVPEPAPPKPAARVERPVAEPAAAPQPAPVVDRPVVMPALQVAPASSEPRRAAPAAPSVRRFAREIGIDINRVTGTGPAGRISVQDVKDYSRSLHLEAAKTVPGIVLPGGALPDFAKWGAVERQPMNNIRVKTAQHLSLAWNTIPQVTQFDKADITELDNQRKHFGEKVAAAGGKLTVTAILLKVLASALRVFPQFNASVDMARNEIVYKKYYHIGVAVDTDRGLLVPVLRNADKKNILQLSIELNQLAEKARNKKLTLEEMQGGTFTITNLGGIGGTAFSPIVNHPEVAILGISRSSIEPSYRNGQFVPTTVLPLSLSYDHRLIDGADAARFLRWVAEALADPFLMALEG
jgi:pyruvate dehydrogenase E2 component (dihydrolipoyllysine-residue acetyltransferase)